MRLRPFWSRYRPRWQQQMPERGVHVLGTTMAEDYEPPTAGLAGYCAHGIGMLDQCDQCCPEEKV